MAQSLGFLSVLALPSREKSLEGSPPGCDVMGTVPSVAVTVTLYRDKQGKHEIGTPRSFPSAQTWLRRGNKGWSQTGSRSRLCCSSVGLRIHSLL